MAARLAWRVRRLDEALARARRAAMQFEAAREQWRGADISIVEQLPDPLLVLDAAGTVLRANSAARAAFGAEIPAVLRHPGLRAAIDRALATGGAQSADLSLPVPIPREVHAAVARLDPPLPEGGRAIVSLSDRTRERAAARSRADFAANASHELRTPLASLLGFIETLLGPAANDPVAQRRFLAIMAEQGERMRRLVDDLLNLSRIEMTEHQAPTDTVDFAGLLARVAAGFEPRLAAASVRLELDLPQQPTPLPAEADQLAQLAQNLLDNAITHGGGGGMVTVRLAPAAHGDRWSGSPGVVLAVADRGPGVQREHLPRLTERFYRVDKGRARAVGGTGLGLAIVRHIVNRHRGRLVIESEPGAGTTVLVWLPVAPARPDA